MVADSHLSILWVDLIISWELRVNVVASKEAQDDCQQTKVVEEQHREQGDKHAAIQLSCSATEATSSKTLR